MWSLTTPASVSKFTGMSGRPSILLMLCGLLLVEPVLGQSLPLGATINSSGSTITGVTLRVWAPNATAVAVRGQFNNWGRDGHDQGQCHRLLDRHGGQRAPEPGIPIFPRWIGVPQMSTDLTTESGWMPVNSTGVADEAGDPPGFQRREVSLPMQDAAGFLRFGVSAP